MPVIKISAPRTRGGIGKPSSVLGIDSWTRNICSGNGKCARE